MGSEVTDMAKRFVVDNNSDPEEARKALRDLRRTAMMGRRAERALKAIEAEGHYDGQVVVIVFDERAEYYSAVPHRFPAYQSVSRADIPNWDQLAVVCGDKTTGSHGGSKFDQVPVWLQATGWAPDRDENANPTGRWERVRLGERLAQARLGNCRMKKGGEVTFDPSTMLGFNPEGVFRIKRNPDASSKTRAEAVQFAKLVAHCLVNCGMSHEWQLRQKCPQKLLDLQRVAQHWLIEDGIVKRMFNDMLDAIEVVKVMEA
jgi:hypothetical protein